MAVYLDLENIAIGAREANFPKLDINKLLERLLLKGHIVVKKAYCDWDRYKDLKRPLHEAAFELIEIPHVRMSGKNSADIRMVVDALDLCYTKQHVDTFVIISGDSDFSPLVSKLRENAKTVIGMGVRNSTSDLFIANCDQFIYYDDLTQRKPATRAKKQTITPAAKSGAPAAANAATANSEATHSGGAASALTGDQAIDLVAETLDAISGEREGDDPIWGSMIKQTLKRRNPAFDERASGFRSFNALLEEAQKRGLLKLEADEKSGGYRVRSVE